jgi:hypothetical protein
MDSPLPQLLGQFAAGVFGFGKDRLALHPHAVGDELRVAPVLEEVREAQGFVSGIRQHCCPGRNPQLLKIQHRPQGAAERTPLPVDLSQPYEAGLDRSDAAAIVFGWVSIRL